MELTLSPECWSARLSKPQALPHKRTPETIDTTQHEASGISMVLVSPLPMINFDFCRFQHVHCDPS